MRTLAAVTLVGVALAGACHLKEGNEETVTGTVAGVVFRAKEAFATQGTSSPGVPPVRTWTISFFVTDGTAQCTPDPGSGSTTIEVTITRATAPVSSGTYGVDGGTSEGVSVTALLQRLDTAGTPDDVEVATDGTLVIEVLEPNEIRGTLSLTFPRGSVSGSFVAPFCGAAGGQTDAGEADARGDAERLDSGRMDAESDRTVVDSGPVDACGDRRGDSGASCGP